MTALHESRDFVADALSRAQRRLLALQKEDGHWCGELEGDSIVESEYVLTLHLLGRGRDPKATKAVEYVRRQQLPAASQLPDG